MTLENLYQEFVTELGQTTTPEALADLKAAYIGKKGKLSALMRGLKDMSPEERKQFGAASNELKGRIENDLSEKGKEIETSRLQAALENDWLDYSLRDSLIDSGLQGGGLNPLSLVQREVEDIFGSMGFLVLDGPHIETEYYNFEALNTPADHPARDMQDTYWFKELPRLLRTQTSAVQIRGMEQHQPPFKFIVPGKVFRAERTDASHEAVFHQLEGMMVGEGINVSHLIYFMKTLLSEVFRRDVEVRLRPGYFPFVEPGFELDIRCLICNGAGCSVCKRVGWVELLPCGLVHPNVLKYGKVDIEKYSGFAFGMGLDRLAMMRYGIDDIRLFQSGDLRFSSQFRSL